MKNPILAALILLNAFDVVLHVGIDRVEPLRVSGNGLIILAALLAAFSPSIRVRRSAVATGLVGYAGLNGWFVLQAGIGPVGAVLIAATLALSGLYIWRAKPS